MAIVAVGASQVRYNDLVEKYLLLTNKLQVLPRYDEFKNVVPEEIVNISASGDHRLIDGATMARFVRHFKKQIEFPYLLFLNIKK